MPSPCASTASAWTSRLRSATASPLNCERAALSVVCNIVEGSARRTTSEYCQVLNVASGSLAETRYLIDVSRRLGFLSEEAAAALEADCRVLAARPEVLQRALRGRPEP